jgi:hypothetical protein
MNRILRLALNYNVSLQTLVHFLHKNDYPDVLTPHSKLLPGYESIINEAFKKDKERRSVTKARPLKNLELSQEKFISKQGEQNFWWALRSGETLRIPIEGKQQFSFEKLFGACFIESRKVEIFDPYIRDSHSFANLKKLLDTIQKKATGIGIVEVYVTTCCDSVKTSQNEESIAKKFSNMKLPMDTLNLKYRIAKKGKFHDRKIIIDNSFLIDLSRGVQMFSRESNEALDSTIFITKINKETQIARPDVTGLVFTTKN